MQSCKPIVATRIPGHLHLLDESCATLVVAQADTLAQGILNALREPLTSKVLGKEALARVAEQYSLASFNHKMRQAYKQLTSGSAA
jgi:glycosyltransferase involved in cell wall biosynthesis